MPGNEERPVETDLYYLLSRYYDPEIGRFISPDSTDYLELESITGLNLYAYCNNDPVNYADPSGCFAIPLTILGLIIGAGTGAIITHATGVIGLSITPHSILVVKGITVYGSYPAYINAAAIVVGVYSIPNAVEKR